MESKFEVIYDKDTHEDDVKYAMEVIEGLFGSLSTTKEFLSEEPSKEQFTLFEVRGDLPLRAHTTTKEQVLNFVEDWISSVFQKLWIRNRVTSSTYQIIVRMGCSDPEAHAVEVSYSGRKFGLLIGASVDRVTFTQFIG